MKWTPEAEARVRAEYPRHPRPRLLAAELGTTLCSLRTRARLLGVRRREFWGAAELAAVRARYGREPAAGIARDLGRPVGHVHRKAWSLGLCFQSRAAVDDAFLARLRELHAAGWSDHEAAGELGCERHTVSRHRLEMGLPANTFSERRRGRVQERTARQLEACGCASLGEVRREAYRAFARRHGWPDDLRPRHVQVLSLLAARGVPLSRRQIADALGMPWKGSRKSLTSNDPEGSYLAHLAARGLVTLLPRALTVLGRGRGRSCHLYCLGPQALAILQERAREVESCQGGT